MKVTAQEEYGLRCLLQLARESSGCKTIPEIAAAESLSQPYVAKLMRLLRTAGFVKSIRGQKGGYRLARPAAEISVGAALSALGGHLYSQDFCDRYPGNEHICVHDTDCSIRSLFAILEEVVQRALQGTMLTDLLCSEQDLRVLHQLGGPSKGAPETRG
jgi:Rrf2 family protein